MFEEQKRDFSFKKSFKGKKYKNKDSNFIFFNKILFVLIVFTGVFYMGTVNSLTVKGFELQKLQKIHKRLLKEKKENELEITTIESRDNIDEIMKDLDMVYAGSNIKYVLIKDLELARK